MPEYVVAYDVVEQGFWGMRLVVPLAWLAGLLIGGGVFLRNWRRREYGAVAGVCLLLAFWVCAGIFGVGNVVRQQLKCIHQAKSGDFEVVEGEVRDFKTMSPWGKGSESFTVNGVAFRYSDNDLSRGGFNNSSVYGGPMREGLHVRIAHRDGRILRIEVRR